MEPYIILGTVLALPLVLGVVFRVSSSHLFFSLMAGELLARTFGDDVERFVESVTHNQLIADYSTVVIILLPMFLTAIFLKGSLSRGKIILHFAPLIVTGVVLAAFLLPELPADLQAQVRSIKAGQQLLDMSPYIIGGVVALQLVALWILHQPHEKHKKHHKKH